MVPLSTQLQGRPHSGRPLNGCTLLCVCVAMASAMPGQQPAGAGPCYVSAVGHQYVGGPAQPQAPVHPQQQPAPHMHHQPGPNEASLAELISFD